MRSISLTMGGVLLAMTTVGSQGTTAPIPPGQDPGRITRADVWIQNKQPHEAVPVVVQGLAEGARPLPVRVEGTSAVTVANTVLTTAAGRTAWEYRRERVGLNEWTPGNLGALNALGADGWEAFSVVPLEDRDLLILLKRPLAAAAR